ncbi:MAG: helix-turn-helix domain-containing protein [Rhodanobacter sp.]
MTAPKKANAALAILKEAILEHLANHPGGLGNSEIARDLGLESDFQGKQSNYLSWSVIGLLVNEGRVVYEKRGRNVFYKLP